MSDTPTSPASVPPPTPLSTEPQRRPWTILGRLSKAVREQNWFAVVLELVIVVLGVLIAFQVTAWGQARSDRATEQTYLRQLVADLSTTERVVSIVDARERRYSGATASLLHAYYQPEPPSADSLTVLYRNARRSVRPSPVMGTVEALVATGDLNLIRNDSLRTAITEYHQETRQMLVRQPRHHDSWRANREQLARYFDPGVMYAAVPEAQIDSLARADPLFPLPQGPRVALPPLDREAFLSDTDARHAVDRMLFAKSNLARIRSGFRRHAAALREQVEAELNR